METLALEGKGGLADEAGPLFLGGMMGTEVLNSKLEDRAAEIDTALIQAGEFYLVGSVTTDSAHKLAQAMLSKALEWAKAEVKPAITLTIFSTGGVADAGFHLAATLKRIKEMGFEIVVRVQGGAYSMGFILAQFATKRIMDSTAAAHIHTLQVAYGYHPEVIIFQDEANHMAKRKLLIATIFAEANTAGHTEAEYWLDKYLDGREHYLTADEALAEGLIDEVL